MTVVKRVFKVKGKPFFPIGGQSSSASAYSDNESEQAFKAVELLHGNCLLTDAYWEKIEPEEGKFDFTTIDDLIASARRHEIKLIILWFATWKNAAMDYAPAWVKNNPQRFKRVISTTGSDIWSLSPHCKANQEADAKAFTALCKHLKAVDSEEQTVIGLQVENEPGILGSDRDYGTAAQADFDRPVPAKLIALVKAAGKGELFEAWQKAGAKKSGGTWPELFGSYAGEYMTAWSIANYIDSVAAAGKAVYNIPMYMNAWMMMHPQWALPGTAYPSGGAVAKLLDLYKAYTPHLDLIAPDIKSLDSPGYEEQCAQYTRDDNPLFMPETPATVSLFRAIADYNLLGFHRMGGLESVVAADGSVSPGSKVGVDTIRCAAAAVPLIIKYQGTGKIFAIGQEENVQQQFLNSLDGWLGRVQFGSSGPPSHFGKDWRHSVIDGYSQVAASLAKDGSDGNRGRGMVIQVSTHEFYFVGVNYRVFLRPKPLSDEMRFQLMRNNSEPGRYVSVEEGHFDKNGKFIVDRTRNGDVIGSGLWVEADLPVLRVITCY